MKDGVIDFLPEYWVQLISLAKIEVKNSGAYGSMTAEYIRDQTEHIRYLAKRILDGKKPFSERNKEDLTGMLIDLGAELGLIE